MVVAPDVVRMLWRGFFATAFQPGDPQAGLAALEAVFGLLIEISFIATFTQRFFGAK